MKTWEMIRDLIKYPAKKFETEDWQGGKLVVYNADEITIGALTSRNVIVAKDSYGVKPLRLNDFIKERRWKEVNLPVDFMTAFEAFSKKKTIRVIRGDHTKVFKGTDQTEFSFHEQDIRNGKWYIED